VAIVVPSKSYVTKFAEEKKINSSFEELCKNEDVKKHILENMKA